jgi:uncharacterized cupredoxin-like copper-binding protein
MTAQSFRRPCGRGLTARRTSLAVAAVVLAAAGVSACGGSDSTTDDAGLAADPSAGEPRTIEIDMTDNEFSPTRLEVEADETVRLVFRNEGEATHDAVIGDEAAQAEHEAEMRATDSSDATDTAESSHDPAAGMDHGSSGESESDEGAVTLEPGETGEITHTFAAGDALVIGCHEPGHYEAGMKIAVEVATA